MRVRALEKFEYANKLRLPGEEFDTDNDAHADVLALARRVEKVTVQTRDMKADTGRPRYRHRAMRADE